MKTLFLTSSAVSVLDNVIKHLPKNPKDYNLAFIPTASEVEEGEHWWINDDRNKLTQLGFNLIEFSITSLTKTEIEEKLKNIDIIFVCGGNVFYLLDQSIKTGFDQIILEKSQKDLIYIGSSAGSMLVGKKIELASTLDDRLQAPDLKSNGIGLIDLAVMPHWGSQKFKDEYLSGFNSIYEANTKLVLLNDNQYLFVQNENYKIIQI